MRNARGATGGHNADQLTQKPQSPWSVPRPRRGPPTPLQVATEQETPGAGPPAQQGGCDLAPQIPGTRRGVLCTDVGA